MSASTWCRPACWRRAWGRTRDRARAEEEGRLLALDSPGGTFVVEPPGGAVARVYLEAPAGDLRVGWQEIGGGAWTPFAQDLRDLAAAIRGERPPPFGPVHDFVVQETLLRASGAL